MRIDYRFAVGVYEVTFDEWYACVDAGGCGSYVPDIPNDSWDRENRPVMNVSWEDAQSYVRWLSDRTGKTYRLLSESEWEYVARAGTETAYSWGDSIGVNRANCNGCGSQWDDKQTAPVGSFAANAWGVHDMHGNVWEWVQDCWNSDYEGAPTDGSAWESEDCSYARVAWWFVERRLRGYLRSVNRDLSTTEYRNILLRFSSCPVFLAPDSLLLYFFRGEEGGRSFLVFEGWGFTIFFRVGLYVGGIYHLEERLGRQESIF